MDIKKFLSESRAVSPVIGVILMVAITVILAAVIGTFVLGLGDQVGDTAPQASFSFDYNETSGDLIVTHESGDAIDGDLLTIAGSGLTVDDPDAFAGTDVKAGSSATVTLTDVDNGDEVRLVWTSESGSNSATLQKYTYNA
ncbi:type IV pilin [Haloferax sp. Atlit-10N]|uniref:type IV pilin n=1 Tax=unclassified Haloferax TaxID=2625095 RepID=UPI000E2583B4|nr:MULTISPECIES: type IV pilin N-terminal domain-containing protein [unclassified Haloferax]RDZ42617.1 type IV pilin [Haloferax sp. Atlit-16N]RDZ57489.1 type IV pilin [Haloferax sp. Atlit-10N]